MSSINLDLDSSRRVRVTAPSRLHFGLLSFGQSCERQFGGVGVMLDSPGLEIEFAPAESFAATGPLAARAAEFAHRVCRYLQHEPFPAQVHIRRAPPDHVGLGTGTQLGMSVAAGLHALWNLEATTEQLAASVERGERSAIGVHGFRLGGLIVEAGKGPGESLGPLVARVALPETWRFVLLRPQHPAGISGHAERQAFAQLPPVPLETTARLRDELYNNLLPAAQAGDFTGFSRSLYTYGLTAGECFAARQGGPFASSTIEQLVTIARRLGVEGVGQSSWGPTLFALLPTHLAAEDFVAELPRHATAVEINTHIAAANQQGAQVHFDHGQNDTTAIDPVVADARPIASRAGRASDE